MLSADYFVEKIDEATRVNRDAKQVCNFALSLARGRIQNLQTNIEAKDARIEELKTEVAKLRAEMLGNCEILQDTSGNITFKCSSGSGEDRWIPCSERLPDNYADVLIQIEYRDRCRNDIRVGYHSRERKKWFLGGFANSHGSIPDGLVIAWQPLPEYYEEPEVEEPIEDDKFEVGDFVVCISDGGSKIHAIYTGEDKEVYWILDKSTVYPQDILKKHWRLKKCEKVVSTMEWLLTKED